MDGYILGLVWSDKTKIGLLKNNHDQKLPTRKVAYSKTHENFVEMLVSSAPNRGPTFKRINFSEKNSDFPTPIYDVQLRDFRAIYRWKELFKLNKITY